MINQNRAGVGIPPLGSKSPLGSNPSGVQIEVDPSWHLQAGMRSNPLISPIGVQLTNRVQMAHAHATGMLQPPRELPATFSPS